MVYLLKFENNLLNGLGWFFFWEVGGFVYIKIIFFYYKDKKLVLFVIFIRIKVIL